MTDKEKTSEMTTKSLFLIALLTAPLLIAFAALGRFHQGIGACGCLTVVLIVAKYGWKSRKSIYFWVAIAIMLLLQIPIVLYVPWEALFGRAFVAFGLADCAVGLGLLKLAEVVAKNKDKSDAGN
jgi:hypothetical protein